MQGKRLRSVLMALASLVLVATALTGCGDDEGTAGDEATGADEETTSEAVVEPEMLDLMITEDGFDGLPDEIMGGAVTVDITSEDPEAEIEFSLVAEGTTEDEFREGVASIVQSGPFPDSFLNNAGAVPGGSTLMLEPGSYFVWSEPPSGGGEEATPPEDFIVAPLTVTEANGAELPETGGTITAVDYAFDVDVEAGDSFTFVNEGAEQFHHAIIFDFGASDAAAVEENLLPFLESEGAEPPAGLEKADFAGGSGVFGPGSTGTAPVGFEDGSTYAVVCFISDKAGGPPHVFGESMFEVFTVGAAG